MYPNDNYFTLVDTEIPESVLEVRRVAEARKAAKRKNRGKSAQPNQARTDVPSGLAASV